MGKYRIYIDETGNSDLGSSDNHNHRFLSLTGIIIDLDYVESFLYPDMEKFKKQYFFSHPDEPIIFHRKEMVQKRPPFHVLKDPETEIRFNSELLHKLNLWDYKVITVLIDKKEHKELYSVWRYDPYHYCLALLMERYYSFLKDNKQCGDVMVESRGAKEDMRL